MILDSDYVKNHIIEEAQEDYPMSEEDKNRVYNLYYDLMNERRNVNKDLDTQVSLIDDIMHSVANNEPEKLIRRMHGDVAYISYYDNFLGEGESDKIIKALSENGIPTEILKGVKKSVPFDGLINGVRVKQEIEKEGNNTPVVVSFDIYNKDGKCIYHWGEGDNESYDDEDDDGMFEAPIQYKTKEGKQRKGKVLRRVITPSHIYDIEKIKRNTGREILVMRDAKTGRFCK